jgi:hypothetical protein
MELLAAQKRKTEDAWMPAVPALRRDGNWDGENPAWRYRNNSGIEGD